MPKKLRRLGDITQDLEPLLLEMAIDHDMQWGEILALIHGYLQVHCPESQEQYEGGGNPNFFYGFNDLRWNSLKK